MVLWRHPLQRGGRRCTSGLSPDQSLRQKDRVFQSYRYRNAVFAGYCPRLKNFLQEHGTMRPCSCSFFCTCATPSPTGIEPVPVLFGRIFAHISLFALAIHQGFPAANASSERKSAPKKLYSTFRRGMFEGFWLRRTLACWRKSSPTRPKAPNRAAEMRHEFNSCWIKNGQGFQFPPERPWAGGQPPPQSGRGKWCPQRTWRIPRSWRRNGPYP